MQDDDTANPGMLWVLDGEALWHRPEGPGRKSCADCHGEPLISMSGVAARYPAYDAARGRPIDLEQRINVCRTQYQRATPLPYESSELLALTAFVAHQSKGQPIAIADERTDPAVHRSRAVDLRAPPGPAQPVLRAVPRRQLGKASRRRADPAGAPDRLSALSPRMADPRIDKTAAARMLRRDAGRTLSRRRPEIVDLELFLAWRAGGLPIETPAIRP